MAPRKRTLPPLPSSVHSALGPIPVELVKELFDEKGEPCSDLGEIDYHSRRIRIVKKLDRVQAHHTLRHEWVHGVLFDSGLHNILPEALEEQICDVIATALVAELQAKLK